MKADLNKTTAENFVAIYEKLRSGRYRMKEWENTLYEVAKREVEQQNESQAD